MALPIFQRTVVKDNGDIIPNAQVEVRLESSGALATLYSDRAGTVALSNPFSSDSSGLALFYANPDEYKITATGSSGSVVWRYVVVQGITTAVTDADGIYYDNTSSGFIADNVQDAIDELNSSLGTAASEDVTTSPTDTTAGRLLKVGDNGTDQFPLLAPLASPELTGSPTIDNNNVIHTGNEQQIGVNQTWQDVTASRSAGVTYANTTGKPIVVWCRLATGSTDLFYVGSVVAGVGYANTATQITSIVPNGSTYSWSSGANIVTWSELR